MSDDTVRSASLEHRAQLARGFRSLRFTPGLEAEFRRDWIASGMLQLRAALTLGCLFSLAFLGLDYFLGGPGFSDTALLYRAAVSQSLLLAMLLATFNPAWHSSLQFFGVAVCISIAGASIFIRSVGETHGLGSPFMGHLVITFYAYLFIGLRFWPAVGAAMSILVLVLGGALVNDMPVAAIIYAALFLVFANLIGSSGLYNLEYNRRKSFLEAKELQMLADSDPLTGLANRSTFTAHLDRVWRHCKRTGESLTVALLDVDQFKKYNDHYGHQAGDRCLQRIAALIGEVASRPFDLAARYGGEEFVLVLPNCQVAHARDRLETVREAVEGLAMNHDASNVAEVVTISAGVAQVSPVETNRSPDGLVQMADEALYVAKTQGRNRVIVTAEDSDLVTGLFRPSELAASG